MMTLFFGFWMILLMSLAIGFGGWFIYWMLYGLAPKGLPRIDPSYGFVFGALVAALFIPGLNIIAFLVLAGLTGYVVLSLFQSDDDEQKEVPVKAKAKRAQEAAAAKVEERPHPAPVHRPRPPREPVMVEARYPNNESCTVDGPFDGVLRAATMLVVVVVGLGALTLTRYSTARQQRPNSRNTDDVVQANVLLVAGGANEIGPDDTIIEAGELGRQVLFTSNARHETEDAMNELIPKITQFLGTTLQAHYPGYDAATADWKPEWEWIKREIVDERIIAPSPHGDDMYVVQVAFDMTQQRLDQIFERYRSDNSWNRTVNVAKSYGGAILILGGMSIFLRLGTGRKPTAVNVAT